MLTAGSGEEDFRLFILRGWSVPLVDRVHCTDTHCNIYPIIVCRYTYVPDQQHGRISQDLTN